MKILLICAENYSRGGSSFARAVGNMVIAYRRQGAEVLGFSPFFSKFEQESDYAEVEKPIEKLRNLEYSVLKHGSEEPKGDFLIRFDDYFGRDGIYGDEHERSYMDNHLRFSFLASAAMDYCIKMNFKPDAIHVHEWSGIAGALTRTVYRDYFKSIPVVLTIHSIRYDFHCTSRHITKIGLPAEDFNADGYEFWDKISLLKVAILYADKVVFTSSSYLSYLLGTDLPGGMRGFLESQSRKLLGIQSGIDYDIWKIPEEYECFKKEKKTKFKEELGLEANSDMLLYSHLNFDSSVSTQVIATILADLLKMNLQFAIGISKDNPNYSYFVTIQEKNRSKMALLPFTDDDKSLLYRLCAADIFFAVSAEHPSLENFFKASAACCVPLSSKRSKAASPLIKAYGISEEDNRAANAFVAETASPDQILEQLRLAGAAFEDKNIWNTLIVNSRATKVSWDETAKNYFSTFGISKGL
jgi:starch synthase